MRRSRSGRPKVSSTSIPGTVASTWCHQRRGRNERSDRRQAEAGRRQADGDKDREAEGKAQNALGKAKDAAGEALDAAGDKLKDRCPHRCLAPAGARHRLIARVRPLIVLVAVTAVWGVTFVQVKDAVALYPLFAFLALRFAIASCALAPVGAAAAAARSGRRGLGAGGARRRAARRGLRPADGRARADVGLVDRLHHRDVRRADAAARARCSSEFVPRARRGSACCSRPSGSCCSRAACTQARVGRRPARARRRRRLLAADRPDGALRAALRRDRVHARRDGRGVRRAARRRDLGRASSRGRTAGRSGARCSSPASSRARSRSSRRPGRSAGRRRPRPRSRSRSSRSGRRSSGSRSPATGSAASPGSAAP